MNVLKMRTPRVWSTLLRVLPLVRSNKWWYLYTARASLWFGVWNLHREIGLYASSSNARGTPSGPRFQPRFVNRGPAIAGLACGESRVAVIHT